MIHHDKYNLLYVLTQNILTVFSEKVRALDSLLNILSLRLKLLRSTPIAVEILELNYSSILNLSPPKSVTYFIPIAVEILIPKLVCGTTNRNF